MNDQIRVSVRVRPFLQRWVTGCTLGHVSVAHREIDDVRCCAHWQVNEHERTIYQTANENVVFTYGNCDACLVLTRPPAIDHTFGPTTTNEQIYEHTVAPLVDAAMQGYNGTTECVPRVCFSVLCRHCVRIRSNGVGQNVHDHGR
jgi:hypothetical protein